MKLPDSGCVLGIDVGYSARRATTGLCLLSWTSSSMTWRCQNTTTDRTNRVRDLGRLFSNTSDSILAVGIDGPLRPNLTIQDTYRTCEALLSRGSFQRRGKPGQCSSPVGRRLHREATTLANIANETCNIETARFIPRIHEKAVVEAFPNLFLGVLCDEASYPARPARRRKWTDDMFPIVRETLKRMLLAWLPGRRVEGELNITDHEHIAGLVCALSALSASTGDGVFVGSDDDGYIILPPLRYWGKDSNGLAPWASTALNDNHPTVIDKFPGAQIQHLNM